jgi:hypothetical protein
VVVGRPSVALATSEELPELDPDSALALPALAERGIDARPVAWSDARVDWSEFDAVVLRSVWDYFHHAEAFDSWVESVAGQAPLWNPAGVVRWNAHKGYLAEFGERGVPVIESLALPHRAEVDLAHVLDEHGWEDAIFKPAVAGGALGLERVRGSDEARAAQPAIDGLLAGGEVLVQPFLRSIVDEGELSLVYFDGRLSHTVLKQAKPGDIRVQPQHGGVPQLVEPSAEAVGIAELVLDAVDAELLYARVDLVRADDGSLRLIELEVIEPLLFLELDPAAASRYADAIAARVGR